MCIQPLPLTRGVIDVLFKPLLFRGCFDSGNAKVPMCPGFAMSDKSWVWVLNAAAKSFGCVV